MEISRFYTVIMTPAEEGGYWAYVPALPGCFTQGKTEEEVIEMIKEAVPGFIESLAKLGKPIPAETPHPHSSVLSIEVKTPAHA
jgi:predicted RNase H-like HicB family nuclease